MAPRWHQDGAKMGPDGAKMAQDWAKMAKMGPRFDKDVAKIGQDQLGEEGARKNFGGR